MIIIDSSIKTERLKLREINENDAEAIVSLRSDINVYQYFYNPQKLTIDNHRRWYNENYKYDDSRIDWMAENAKTEDCIGIYGLKRIDEETAEISYITNSQYLCKGYATEAVEAIIWWSVEYWSIKHFVVSIHEKNVASISFAKKLGFVNCTEGKYSQGRKRFVCMEKKFSSVCRGIYK